MRAEAGGLWFHLALGWTLLLSTDCGAPAWRGAPPWPAFPMCLDWGRWFGGAVWEKAPWL